MRKQGFGRSAHAGRMFVFGLIVVLFAGLVPAQARPGAEPAASAGRVMFLPTIFAPIQPPPPPVTPISVWTELRSPGIVDRGDRVRIDINVRNESTIENDVPGTIGISVPFDPRQLRFFTFSIDEGRGDRFLGVTDGRQVEISIGRRIGPGKTHTISVWFNVQNSANDGEFIQLRPSYTYNNEVKRTNRVGFTVRGASNSGLCQPFRGVDAQLRVQPERGPQGTNFTFSNDCYIPGETVKTWLNDPFAPGGVRELTLRATANSRGEVFFNLNSAELGLRPDDRYGLVAQGLDSGITSLGPFIVDANGNLIAAVPPARTPAPSAPEPAAGIAQEPVPTGSISGLVSDENSTPLAGVLVAAFDAEDNFVETSTTSADGRYSLTDLSDGEYTLGVLASFSSDLALAAYASRFLPATVSDGGDTTVDVSLLPGGRIQGTVRADDSGAGLPGVEVFVYADGDQLVGIATTDTTGAYTTTAVLSGSYELEFEPAFSDVVTTTNYVSATLSSIVVTAPNNTTGNDVSLALRPDIRTISGQVTAQDNGLGLPDVLVAVLSEDGTFVDAIETGPNGGYRSDPLPAGVYTLEFITAFTADSATRQYIGRALETPVDMTADGPRNDVDIALERGAQISGRIISTATDTGLPGVLVAIFNEDDNENIIGLGLSNEEGIYVSSGLPPGNYTIVFFTDFAGGITASYRSITESINLGTSDVALNIELERDPARLVYLPIVRSE